jgi:asparagine synthase (glutamine-hydrolysing)
MDTTRRGTGFFVLLGSSDDALTERLLTAARDSLGCRGRLSALDHPLARGWLAGETTPSTPTGPRDPLVLELARSIGRGEGALSVVIDRDGARLRGDALGRGTLHATRLGPSTLLVATTLAPLVAALRAAGHPVCFDRAALRRFFTYSYVPAPFTAFEGVFTVPPAHETTFSSRGELGPFRRWYDVPPTVGATWQGDDEAASSLRAILSEAMAVPPTGREAVLLSGGLDSAFVAWAARSRPGLRALTLDFEEDSEADAAAGIAHTLGLPHERHLVRAAEAQAALLGAARALDTPIGDPVVVPFFHLAEREQGRVDTLFNGEGGDQLFAGWATKPLLAWARYAGPDDRLEDAYVSTFHKLHDVRHEAFGPALRDVPFDPAGDLAPFLSDERAARHDGFFHLLCDANLWLKGASNLLPRIDRCLGAHGIVAESPLLDPRFVAAAFAIAPRQKQRGTTEKWILRHALASELPPAILDLPKRGMRVPISTWLAGPLLGFAREMLTSSRFRARGWLDPAFVERLLAGEVRSPDLRKRRRDEWLWMALFAAVWAEAHEP